MEADSNIIVQSHGVFTGFDHSLQDFFRYRSRLVVTNADSPAYGRTYTHKLLFICYCNHPDPSHLPSSERQYVKFSLPWRELCTKSISCSISLLVVPKVIFGDDSYFNLKSLIETSAVSPSI